MARARELLQDSFIRLLSSGSLADIQRVLENPTQPLLEMFDKNGSSALMIAVASGHREVAEYLIRKNPDPEYLFAHDHDRRNGKKYGRNIIHCAVESGNPDLLAFIVSRMKEHDEHRTNEYAVSLDPSKKPAAIPLFMAMDKGLNMTMKMLELFSVDCFVKNDQSRGNYGDSFAKYLAQPQNAAVCEYVLGWMRVKLPHSLPSFFKHGSKSFIVLSFPPMVDVALLGNEKILKLFIEYTGILPDEYQTNRQRDHIASYKLIESLREKSKNLFSLIARNDINKFMEVVTRLQQEPGSNLKLLLNIVDENGDTLIHKILKNKQIPINGDNNKLGLVCFLVAYGAKCYYLNDKEQSSLDLAKDLLANVQDKGFLSFLSRETEEIRSEKIEAAKKLVKQINIFQQQHITDLIQVKRDADYKGQSGGIRGRDDLDARGGGYLKARTDEARREDKKAESTKRKDKKSETSTAAEVPSSPPQSLPEPAYSPTSPAGQSVVSTAVGATKTSRQPR